MTASAAAGMLRAMDQLSLFSPGSKVLTVSEVNRYLRLMMEDDDQLQELWVRGEVSNLSRPSSGHLYFTLKDAQAALRCVMWRADAQRLPMQPREGEAREVHGHISLYEAGGQVQLYADDMRQAGEGVRFQEFLRLKAALAEEGLFDAERKRPLPAWPQRIGLVTSPSGAALRDVLTVLQRRYPIAEVLLAATSVQGEEAPAGIRAALRELNRRAKPDLILVVRGGGSMEDLWAFNEESVVRAIAASVAPVVTGIGHATDFTLADFAADVRAATPSAAAEIATPHQQELRQQMTSDRRRLALAFVRQVGRARVAMDERLIALRLVSPRAQLANVRQQLDDRIRRAVAALAHAMALRRAAVQGLAQTLTAVGPQAVLARGYAIVTRADDRRIVRSVLQVRPGLSLDLRVGDGTIPAKVSPPGGKE